MEGCSRLPTGKQGRKMLVAVALGVLLVTSVAAVLTVLCHPAAGYAVARNGSGGLAQLEETQRGLQGQVATLELALANTNRSLAQAHGQWDGYRRQLGALEEKVSELERALERVTRLQEENQGLQAEVARQQEQLGDLQSRSDNLQLQNQRLREQLRDVRSQRSGGGGLGAGTLTLLAPLLPGMLLL